MHKCLTPAANSDDCLGHNNPVLTTLPASLQKKTHVPYSVQKRVNLAPWCFKKVQMIKLKQNHSCISLREIHIEFSSGKHHKTR